MNKKVLKIIVGFCFLVLIIDLIIFMNNNNIQEAKNAYFDSINSFEVLGDSIISVGSNSNNKKGYEKAKITLYDYNYNKKWETLYNKKYNSSFFAVKKDEDNYIAVGSFEANKEEHKDLRRSAVIVKFDENGDFLSEKRFQLLGDSKFTNLVVVDDGYIVVGQSIYENMTLGLSDKGGAFIIKYDKELKEVWRKNYGGSKSGIYNDLLIKDDCIYVVGKDLTRQGVISKYSLDGEYIDTATYDETDTFGFTGISIYEDNIYVVGSKKVRDDEKDYDTDALIVKYDLDLDMVADQTYKGTGKERFNKVIIDSNSNVVTIGQTGIYNKKKSIKKENVFVYNGVLAKYDLDLKELLVEDYGDEKDDYFTHIVQFDDTYLVGGYSNFDGSYLSKFVIYTRSGKIKEVSS